MTITSSHTSRTISGSDALINGLFSGILAGLVMLVFLVFTGLAGGDDLTSILTRFSVPSQQASPLASAFLHLGVSAVYGSLFGVLFYLLPRRYKASPWKWMAGLFFGLLLYALAGGVLLPTTSSRLLEVPALVLAAAHVLYGLALGVWTRV